MKRKGTHRFSERDRIRIDEVNAITAAGMTDDQEVMALITWILRNISRSPSAKRLDDWTVEEIIEFASKIDAKGMV